MGDRGDYRTDKAREAHTEIKRSLIGRELTNGMARRPAIERGERARRKRPGDAEKKGEKDP
jgi:hypothetical protein